MPRLNASNNFATTLAQNITNTDTTFDVVDASNAPATPFRMTIRTGDPANGEIIEVGSVATNTFSSVQRGMEGTTAQSWSSGDIIEQLGTAGMHSELADLEDLTAPNIDFNDTSFFTTAPDVATALNALSSAGVVDEGTTADGDYIRYDNGWQICITSDYNIDLNEADGSIYRNTTLSVNLPVSFVDNNYYAKSEVKSSSVPWGGGAPNTTSFMYLRGFSAQSRTSDVIHGIAIGRWK